MLLSLNSLAWIDILILTQTLLCPVMFSSIGKKTLYIFAISNVITIPMVWALYPESNQRTLEEMDLLFAAETPWVWDAEKRFAMLKVEYPEIAHAAHSGKIVHDGSGKIIPDPERAEIGKDSEISTENKESVETKTYE
jgi:hypothetical protein